MATVSTVAFYKTIQSLEMSLSELKTDVTRDASIRRFVYCIELTWKCFRQKMGTSTTAPKQVVREMAQNNFIQNVELWIEAIDYRNLSSHTYDEVLAEKVFVFAKSFLPELKKLSDKLL